MTPPRTSSKGTGPPTRVAVTGSSCTTEDLGQISKEYVAFTDDLVARGLMRGGEQFPAQLRRHHGPGQ